MTIRDRVVEGQVCEEAPINVDLLWGFGRENESLGVDSTLLGLSLEIVFGVGRVLQEPEDGVRHALQDVHPASEGRGINLVELVEVGENEFVFGETLRATCRSLVLRIENITARVGIVVDEVAVWHVDHFLGVEAVEGLRGRRYTISHDVVDKISAHRAAESHELDLYRRWPQREHICALSHRPPVQVE
eukprot:CAMPEP_0185599236 /NCGR_PEP_ID=MMETSP0434-20130131/82552_1 /TAXON_ID=626734 ORGANISM="Favella taraikaensis, Strain Fe Narragansett Bay" /NCGR_SAMPLE_ID=MMETSP0434 /ASSEMBLY_ACC=CAM_ASM_000379 /LENGTH=188 /DNA_ID=CAMNT_0028228535 /DNA_START=366 /DNA_END=932 /DNA_ORIENTATION=+